MKPGAFSSQSLRRTRIGFTRSLWRLNGKALWRIGAHRRDGGGVLHYEEMRLRTANPFSIFERMSRADCSTFQRRMSRLEPDYEQARWGCDFYSGVGLFFGRAPPPPFPDAVRRTDGERRKPPLISAS